MSFNSNTKKSSRRSYGGVYVVPLFSSPFPCGGDCIYCPKVPGFPDSYIPNKSTLLAKNYFFSPAKQLSYAIENIKPKDFHIPLEIIILGGSFSSLSPKYRKEFMSSVYGFLSENHDYDQSLLETSRFRCSILTIESRPDQINDGECNTLRELGVSKVEIGVQHLNDDILGICNRGHGTDDIKKATRILKDHGFKVGYHVMIGLPGSNQEIDKEMLEEKLWLPEYSPDFLKLYPCVLLNDRNYQPKLHKLVDSGKWSPPTRKYFLHLLKGLASNIPSTVRISRVQRFFQEDQVIGGFFRGIREDSVGNCQCIRCREAGKYAPMKFLSEFGNKYVRITKQYSDVCFEVIDENDTLFGLARLRLGTGRTAILRELHVYGEAAPIGQPGMIQGRGVGKSLLSLAETYSLQACKSELIINAAHGAKPFFRKNGYSDNNTGYLRKLLDGKNTRHNPDCLEQNILKDGICLVRFI